MSDDIAVVIAATIVGIFGTIFGALALTARNRRQENRTRESSQNAQPLTARNRRQENRTLESSQNAQPLTARNRRQKYRTRESSKNAQFKVLEKLGKGGFGTVYKARDKNGKMFAFKFISPSVRVTIREQIPLLHWNENIINIHGVCNLTNRNNGIIHVPSDVDMPVFAIQLDLCDNTLCDEIYKGDKVRNSKWKFAIFEQILDGVGYLHKNEIIHGDLKPENILFKDGVIKITDFGLAKEEVLNELYAHTGGIGTKIYWVPEQPYGRLYNKKVDVFSLGIIWAEIWVVGGHNIKRAVFFNWASKLPLSFTMDQNVPKNIQTMILKMTEVNSNDRFSISESQNRLSLFNSSKRGFCGRKYK